MVFEKLPRDVQLSIIKRFDIETRAKAGIVFKMRLNNNIVDRLDKINAFKMHVVLLGGGEEMEWLLTHPYNCYITHIGQRKPDVWLDNWYEKEWPLHCSMRYLDTRW